MKVSLAAQRARAKKNKAKEKKEKRRLQESQVSGDNQTLAGSLARSTEKPRKRVSFA